MNTPENLDTFLHRLVKQVPPTGIKTLLPSVGDDDIAFIERIFTSIKDDSQVVIAAYHPNEGCTQYMLLNTNRSGGVELLAKIIARLAGLNVINE